MKMTKRAICLLLAAVMALALTVPVLAMDEPDTPVEALADTPEVPAAASVDTPDANGGERAIKLNAGKEGKFDEGGTTEENGDNVYTVDVTDKTKLSDLPTPGREGWTFEGWWTAEVTYALQLHDEYAKDYWTWIPRTTGTKVNSQTVPADTAVLYAKYTPTVVEYDMYPCGWNNNFGALHVSRQYGVPFDGTVSWETAKWEGYSFDGWWTDLNGGEPLRSREEGTPVGKFTAAYIHWHKDDDPSINQTKYRSDLGYDIGSKLTSLSLASVKPLHVGQTVTVKLGRTPDRANIEGIQWESDNPDAVRVTALHENRGNEDIADSQRADIYAAGEGTATITASVGNVKVSIKVTARHEYKTVNTVKPTCTSEGTEQQVCTYPHCTYRRDVVLPMLKHNFATTETVPATCTTEGHTIQTCSACGYQETTNVKNAPGHAFEVTVKESCGVTVTTRKCKTCGYTESEESGGTGKHVWATDAAGNEVYTVDQTATCLSEGSKSIHCTKCSAVKDITPIDKKTEHKFGAWKTTTPASWDHEGLKTRVCTICGATETEVIEKRPNYPVGGGGGSATPSPSPSESPEPSPSESPSPSPEPGTTPEPGVTPAPSPVPVDPPKTNDGSGWSYDYDTGDYYYFVDGEPKANYWAKEEAASQWGFWYYVGSDGKLATGLQYIVNNNGTGWYFLQPDDANGCIGKMLTGWQWLGPEAGEGWFSTAHGGRNGQCTWTENWGDYDPATGLWADGLSHK